MRTRLGRIIIRVIAFALAVVYVWLSGVLQLAHTDDLRDFATVQPSHTPVGITSIKSLAPEGPCLACEWLGMFHTVTAAGATVALNPVCVSLVHVKTIQALHIACFDDVPFRGPPSLLS